MTTRSHKYIIIFILFLFFVSALFVRSHIKNIIIPERERQIKAELKEEIKQVYISFTKNKFNDSKSSANYLLESYPNYLTIQQSEELKLVIANSILEQVLAGDTDTETQNFEQIFQELELSNNPKIQIDALMGQARGTLLSGENSLDSINKSISYLEEAMEIGQTKNLNYSKVAYYLSNLNVDRYKLNRKYSQKIEAINLLKLNIENLKKQDDYSLTANGIIELALLYARISSIEQIRYNLKQASKIMEEALILIPKEKDPLLNAKIYRIIGDIYYLNSKVPRRQNEAGPRYVQSMVSFQAKAKSAYRKAEQMGIFNDIVPGVRLLKNQDAETRKKIQRNNTSDSQASDVK